MPPGVLYSTTVSYSDPNLFPGVQTVTTDAAGNSYIAGSIASNGLASTPGVVQPQWAGGVCSSGSDAYAVPCTDAFIAKFDSNGALVFLTYLGGTGNDFPYSMAVDAFGDIYIGGTTDSSDFPLAGSPWRPALSGAGGFIAKLSGDGKTLIWSTIVNDGLDQLAIAPDGSIYLLAGTLVKLTGEGQFVVSMNVPAGAGTLAVGSDGSVFIGGQTEAPNGSDVTPTPGAFQTKYGGGTSDGFVAKMGPGLSGLEWLTFLGGSDVDDAGLVQAAPDGSVWVSGETLSSNFPVLAGALQAQISSVNSGFLVHLSADGSKALASTFLAGPLGSMLLDASGNVIVSASYEGGFQATPGTPWPCQQQVPGVADDLGFFGKIDSAGQHLLWGTWTGSAIPIGPAATDANGDAITAGNVPGLGDITLTALTTTPGPPRLVESCIAQAAYPNAVGPLAPGEIFSIYGAGFGPEQGVAAQPSGNTIGTELAGVQVLIEGTPVPLLYVSSAQINLVAPFLLNGLTAAHIQVVTANGTSNEVVLGVAQSMPEIFESQPGVAAIVNPDGSVNGPDHPAHVGDTVAMFISGAGAMNPGAVDGQIPQAAQSTAALPITVQLETSTFPYADITYAGEAPGLVSGAVQVNFLVPPTNTAPGAAYEAGIVLSVGENYTGPGAALWLQ
ncbi:MAG: SBBP repeat-containing protein [Bryobacterales bacterium]|nr:SBBP repeat-containing protein [Bryobacterales bacterium]